MPNKNSWFFYCELRPCNSIVKMLSFLNRPQILSIWVFGLIPCRWSFVPVRTTLFNSVIPTMRQQLQAIFIILTLSLSHWAYADTYICIDANNKKVFSSVACEKKAMKPANSSVALTQTPKTSQVMAAVVISNPTPQSNGAVLDQNAAREIRVGDSHLERPVLYFLIFGIIAAGGLFCMLFYLFFKSHHRKLELGRE